MQRKDKKIRLFWIDKVFLPYILFRVYTIDDLKTKEGMNTLNWSIRAYKELMKGIPDNKQRKKITDSVDELVDFPNVRPNLDIKPLTDVVGKYRLRVGDYRVIFSVEKGVTVIIHIEHVLRRVSKSY
ncbi:mRNA interferase RelE/StbE [Ewingella americana]